MMIRIQTMFDLKNIVGISLVVWRRYKHMLPKNLVGPAVITLSPSPDGQN